MVRKDYSHERAIERLMMYERWLGSSLYRTMRELRTLRLKRKTTVDGGAGGGTVTAGDLGDGEWANHRLASPSPCTCPTSQGNHRGLPLPLDDATSGAGREGMTDSAKQSQYSGMGQASGTYLDVAHRGI